MIRVYDENKTQFLKYIQNKKLIIYGAGYCCKESIEMLNLYNQVYAICDSNDEIIGNEYDVGNRKIIIKNIDELSKMESFNVNDFVILVTTTIYSYDVMVKLDKMPLLDGISVFFYGLIRANFCKNQDVQFKNGESLIPSKIHYCWFGGKPIPDNMKRYMDTWLNTNPEFELLRHDEHNYNIEKIGRAHV